MKTDVLDLEARLRELGIIKIPLPTPFPVGPINAYVIERDPLILVDTGIRGEETYKVLAAALEEHGHRVSDLGAIFLTHGHNDHMGMTGRFAEESGAETYAHPHVKRQSAAPSDENRTRKLYYVDIMAEFGVPEEIREEANSLFGRFRRFSDPFSVEHVMEDGDVALGLKAYHVPGHSPSCTLFVDEELKFCFTGDLLLARTTPTALMRQPPPGKKREKAMVEMLQSLKRARGLDVELCCPGHGDLFDSHIKVTDRILSRLEQRAQKVLQHVAEGHDTPYLVSRRLFPALPTQHIHQGLSVSIGQLEALHDRGDLELDDSDGVLRYHRAS